jgi:hypothetical protein
VAKEVLLIADARIATVQLLEQVLAHLAGTTGLRTRSRLLSELTGEDFTPGTFPVIVRSITPEASRLTRILRKHRIRYGFYLDDNFWLLDPGTEAGRYFAAAPTRRRLEAIVRGASPVIASTPLLRDYLRRFTDDVIQLDSFFDFSLVPALSAAPPAHARVRGGFAASTHRAADLRPVVEDVMNLLRDHDNVEFEVIGIDDDIIPEHPRIRSFPYRSSYEDYVAFQQSREWDFGLAPLGRAASNLYKTDNKYREYAAQGIPGIYEDAPPYQSVTDRETGLIAGKTRSWRDAMELYVGDAGLRARIRRNARLEAEQRCSLENVAPQWGGFFASAPPIGDRPELLAYLRRAFHPTPTPLARAALRGRLLWAYGMTHLAEHGFAATITRTARFLWTRIRPR